MAVVIRYLGVMIDDSVSWKYHIAFISSKITRNICIFVKRRHFVSLQQLKQLYYNLIYPYLICNHCVGEYHILQGIWNKAESYCEIDVLCEDMASKQKVLNL